MTLATRICLCSHVCRPVLGEDTVLFRGVSSARSRKTQTLVRHVLHSRGLYKRACSHLSPEAGV